MRNENDRIFSFIFIIILVTASISGCIGYENKNNKLTTSYQLIAKITVDKSTIYVNETVTFSAEESTGNIISYFWNFTGGNKVDANGSVVKYTFTVPGRYYVKLKVIDVYNNIDYETIWIYVNYMLSFSDDITRGEKKYHHFGIVFGASKMTIQLKYSPDYYAPIEERKIQMENLDLSIYAKYNDSYVYITSSNNSQDNGLEEITLSRYDIFISTDWRIEVYYNITSISDKEMEYELSVGVYYE